MLELRRIEHYKSMTGEQAIVLERVRENIDANFAALCSLPHYQNLLSEQTKKPQVPHGNSYSRSDNNLIRDDDAGKKRGHNNKLSKVLECAVPGLSRVQTGELSISIIDSVAVGMHNVVPFPYDSLFNAWATLRL